MEVSEMWHKKLLIMVIPFIAVLIVVSFRNHSVGQNSILNTPTVPQRAGDLRVSTAPSAGQGGSHSYSPQDAMSTPQTIIGQTPEATEPYQNTPQSVSGSNQPDQSLVQQSNQSTPPFIENPIILEPAPMPGPTVPGNTCGVCGQRGTISNNKQPIMCPEYCVTAL